MKKLLILSAALALCLGTAKADETSLRVTLRDGTTELYSLGEKPRISFSDGNMEVVTSKVSTSYSRADVKSMDFTLATSVARFSGEDVSYLFRDNVFSCPGHDIKAFGIDGTFAGAAGDSLSLQELPSGIYIINVNGKSIKVIRK